ncbi:sugar ABC transporter ATP-binding protein [Pendulispora albinea]|uniref:Sugar ABC transporter ATP-binding protein n=1 Tax=Pendulispora albinea TaxID=2741071 RepID=A0ABZ2M8X8_9BACT
MNESAREPARVAGEPLLEARHVSKSFGPNPVLRDVSFDVRPGEVHVLAGENGAGKSTLLGILAGTHTEYEGEIRVGGALQRFRHPRDAVRAGVATVHQELSLIGPLSVTDNLFLGSEITGPLGIVDARRQAREARALLDGLDLDRSEVHEDDAVESLPISTQQLVEIAKALAAKANVLLLDEPTSALREPEALRLFDRIEALKRQGKGIVYVSHKMDEIYRLADRITVLRDGAWVGTRAASELPAHDLVAWMLGRHLPSGEHASAAAADVLLSVEGLSVSSASSGSGVSGGARDGGGEAHGADARPDVDDLSFELRAGEILGFAGLRGSGASDVLHALFGDRRGRARGLVTLHGRKDANGRGERIDLARALTSPVEAIDRGIMLLTNDRKGKGLVLHMDARENASLASLVRYSPGGIVRDRLEAAATERVFAQLGVRGRTNAPVRLLSGGNQQKIVLAKCLLTAPEILLLDEPTRGVDVGAKAEIYDLLAKWAREGMGIVLVTSELPELLRLSDRILVLHRGRATAEFSRAEATQEKVLHAAFGAAPDFSLRGDP